MKNEFNFELKDYQGAKSTLCTGCGHDNVTQAIINGYFKSNVHPFRVAKLSGIGCSSKTPAYFLKSSHGFNSIHGRMAAVATGAKIANHNLHILGVSGDGDTASIGLSGFLHLIRRNLPMVYIVENNGVYGLTKGQFSATADLASEQKYGDKNPFASLDLCSLAIEAGCEFVARSFSGDAKQLIPLLQAAMQHNGTALIDVISPCITYANHAGSTKSYDYVKEHKVALQELGFISAREPQTVDYSSSTQIDLADGSHLILKKLLPEEHNIEDSMSALGLLKRHRDLGEILTGLFYKISAKKSLTDVLALTDKPLSSLRITDINAKPETFKNIMARYK